MVYLQFWIFREELHGGVLDVCTLRRSIIVPGGLITSPGVGFCGPGTGFCGPGGGLVVINVVASHYVSPHDQVFKKNFFEN